MSGVFAGEVPPESAWLNLGSGMASGFYRIIIGIKYGYIRIMGKKWKLPSIYIYIYVYIDIDIYIYI